MLLCINYECRKGSVMRHITNECACRPVKTNVKQDKKNLIFQEGYATKGVLYMKSSFL